MSRYGALIRALSRRGADITPPKAELEDLGQGLLPGMEDVDFLPPEFVLGERLAELPRETGVEPLGFDLEAPPSPFDDVRTATAPTPGRKFGDPAPPLTPEDVEWMAGIRQQTEEITAAPSIPLPQRQRQPLPKAPSNAPEDADYGLPVERSARYWGPAEPLPDFLPQPQDDLRTRPGGWKQNQMLGAERKRNRRAEDFYNEGPKGMAPMEGIPASLQETGPPEGAVRIPSHRDVLRQTESLMEPPLSTNLEDVEEFLANSGLVRQATNMGIPQDSIRRAAGAMKRGGDEDIVRKLEDLITGTLEERQFYDNPLSGERLAEAFDRNTGVISSNLSPYYADNSTLQGSDADYEKVARMGEKGTFQAKGIREGGDPAELEAGLTGRGWGPLVDRAPEKPEVGKVAPSTRGRGGDPVRNLRSGRVSGVVGSPGQTFPEGEFAVTTGDQLSVPFKARETVTLTPEMTAGQIEQLSGATGASEDLLRRAALLGGRAPEMEPTATPPPARIRDPFFEDLDNQIFKRTEVALGEDAPPFDPKKVRRSSIFEGQSEAWAARAKQLVGEKGMRALQSRLLNIPERFRWVKGMPSPDWYTNSRRGDPPPLYRDELPVAFDSRTGEVLSLGQGGKINRRKVTAEKINGLEKISTPAKPTSMPTHPGDKGTYVDLPTKSGMVEEGPPEATSAIASRLDSQRQPAIQVPPGLGGVIKAALKSVPLVGGDGKTANVAAEAEAVRTFIQQLTPEQRKQVSKEIVKFAVDSRGKNPMWELPDKKAGTPGVRVGREVAVLNEIVEKALAREGRGNAAAASYEVPLNQADVAVIFTNRTGGEKGGRFQKGSPAAVTKGAKSKADAARAAGVPVSENPTAEELKELIETFNFTKIHVITDKPPASGKGANVRAAAIIDALKKGGVKATVAGGIVGGGMFLGEDDAEASPASSAALQLARNADRIARVAKDAKPDGPRLFSRAGALDKFQPLYDAAGDAGERLKEVLSSVAGGGMGKASLIAEPLRFALQSLPPGTTLEDLDRYTSLRQAARLGDQVIPRKITHLDEQARIAVAEGRRIDATKLHEEAEALKKRLSEGTYYWESPDGARLDAATANAELASFPPEMQEAANHIYGAIQNARGLMQEEGLLNARSASLWDEYGGDYIPAWREVPTSSGDLNMPRVRLDLREEKVIDSFTGSTLTPKSPFDNAMQFIENAVREAQINKGTRETLTALQEGAPDLVKPIGGEPLGDAIPPNWSQVAFLEEGVPSYFLVPEELGRVMQMVDQQVLQHMNKALAPLKAPQRLMQTLATTANYGFGLAQPVLDVPTALWQVKDLHTGAVPGFLKVWAEQVKAGFAHEWLGAPSSPERKRFLEAGAGYSSLSSYGDFREEIKGVTGEHLGRAKDMFSAIPHAQGMGAKWSLGAQGANEVLESGLGQVRRKVLQPFEEATKIATHETLLKQGMDPVSASYQTRTFGGSPDFAKGGSSQSFELMKTLIPFIQPTINGLEASIKGPMQDPRKAIIGAAALAGIVGMQEKWNESIGGEGWEGDYTEFDNEAAFIILHPTERETLSNGIERPVAVKIPVAHALRLVINPIRGLFKGDPGTAAMSVVNQFPIGSSKLDGSIESIGNRLGGALNPVLKAPMEQYANKQFFTGTPIESRALANKPAEERYDQRTNPLMVAAGRASGTSPKRLEHLYRSFLPGLGMLPLELAGAGMESPVPNPPAQATSEKLSRAPLVGPLLRRVLPQAYGSDIGDMSSEFYDAAGLARASRSAQLSGNALSSERLEQASKAPAFGRVQRQLGNLNRQRNQIVTSPTLGPEEKREMLRKLQAAQEEILTQFLSSGVVDSLYGRD